MKIIPLSKGYLTVVDDVKYDSLAQHLWHAQVLKNRDGKISIVYAVRFTPMAEGHDYIYIHREIMGVTDKEIHVDHEDHNGLHNCVNNLRICDHAENMVNRRMPTTNTSGYKGVTWEKNDKKWLAQIGYKGKHYNLGMFPGTEEGKLRAAKAYEEGAKRLHGEFACSDNKGTAAGEDRNAT
jgi:AP2 domain